MWEVIDSVVGERVSCHTYYDALDEAERRVSIHGAEYPLGHRGYHYPVKCTIIEDRKAMTLTVSGKE